VLFTQDDARIRAPEELSQKITEVEVESQVARTVEYVYPIAQLDDDCLLVMYQKSFDDLELLIWNKDKKTALKELTSIFQPSYVQLLPSKKAFSFIDRGRIRIKAFQKRGPRSINIPEAIHAISSLTWINDEQFYFVGKEQGYFSIFLCDISDRDVTLFSVHNQDKINYMYPVKVNDSMFCIAKDNALGYAFCKMAWQAQLYPATSSFDQKEMQLYHNHPLCFLHMEDEHSGFVLEYNSVSTDADFCYISCCSLTERIENQWALKKLFQFKLPLQLLTGIDQERLYESINPFLPRYDNPEWIYFVTYDDNTERCCVQRYHRHLQHIEDIANRVRSCTSYCHMFAPLIVDDNVFLGCAYNNTRSMLNTLQTDSMTGMITCNLPKFSNHTKKEIR